ncbi:MAG TPA: glycosyltransferase [Panacibacter sp.]|nr:glycosyltransferase [Panacibacter sp.]HNP45620.1 glycosyltransferase [Panacibacter sp.]
MANDKFELALVICTYNRDRYLPDALESIKNQSFPGTQFQVVIVDNNSTDNTAAISKKFIAENPDLHITYAFEQQKGLSFARNRGVAEADAPVLCYIDDDIILAPGFLNAMKSFYDSYPNAVGAGGRVIPKYEHDKEPEWMNKYLNGFVGRVEHGDKIKKYDEKMKYPAGCNMSYKKNVILKAGGFNNELTFRSDDKYIFHKITQLSTEIYYLPDAYLYHNIDAYRLDIGNFKKLFLKTGNEEKRRIKSEKGSLGVFKKFIEFVTKFGASIVLFFLFLLKGQTPKGKYIVISQWCTLKGFLKKDVFVR